MMTSPLTRSPLRSCLRPDVDLHWEQFSTAVYACRTPALPSQRSDERATCVGYAVQTPFHETWQGLVGGQMVATGPLAVVQRAVEIEAHVRYGPRSLAALQRGHGPKTERDGEGRRP